MSDDPKVGQQAQPTLLGASHNDKTDHLTGKQGPSNLKQKYQLVRLKRLDTLLNHRTYVLIVLAGTLLCFLLLYNFNVLTVIGNQQHSSEEKISNKTSLNDVFMDVVQQVEEHTVSLIA